MKNNRTFIAIIAMALMITAIAIVSCKKEPTPVATNQGKSTLARIRDFQRQLEAVGENPNEKTVTYMSIADAVWNVEALFNYTYALPNNNYGQTICCDTTIYLPVCSNDSVSLADLSVFNGQMYEAVLTLYRSVILDNKQFLILDVEAGQRNGNLQAMELHTVQGSVKGDTPPTPPVPPQNGPFAPGVYWYYGENGGSNPSSNGLIMDAADTLSGMLNYYLVPVAPENHVYIYTQVKMKYTQVGDDPISNPCSAFPDITPRYCEFYKEYPTADDYWLSPDQLNFHFFGEKHLVLNIFPNDTNDPVPAGHSLFQVVVDDYKTYENNVVSSIEHHTNAYYGYRIGLTQDSIDHHDL